MDPLEIALPIGIAFGVSLLATPWVGLLARRAGAVDRPTARGVNRRPDMPLWGGLAIVAGWSIGLGATVASSVRFPEVERLLPVLAGAGLIVVAGLWDDRFGMSAWPKLTFQVVAAVFAVLAGFEIARFMDPFTREIVELPRWLVWPVSLLWIVGITNAMNLLDGLDGLAAGVGVIIGATLTAIAFRADAFLGVCMGLALLGALLGFLPHNFSPARVFLGDTGSMLIGYLLALIALEGPRRLSLITFVVPLLAMAVPILDTTMSVVRRLRMGTPILAADRMHIHHRLLQFEGSTRAAVLQFYFVTAAFCLIAVSFTQLEGASAAVFLLAVAALTLRLLWNMGVFGVDEDENQSPDSGREESL